MKVIIGLLFVITLASCGHNTLPFEQTCITCIRSQRLSCTDNECPATFMVDTNAVVTMVETGENIYVNAILWGESIKPGPAKPFTIAKISGRYFLTGENFNNLWIVTPEEKNMAAYEPVPMPVPGGVKSPVFELYGNKLLLSAQAYTTKYIFNEEDNKWEVFNDPLKGE